MKSILSVCALYVSTSHSVMSQIMTYPTKQCLVGPSHSAFTCVHHIIYQANKTYHASFIVVAAGGIPAAVVPPRWPSASATSPHPLPPSLKRECIHQWDCFCIRSAGRLTASVIWFVSLNMCNLFARLLLRHSLFLTNRLSWCKWALGGGGVSGWLPSSQPQLSVRQPSRDRSQVALLLECRVTRVQAYNNPLYNWIICFCEKLSWHF